MTPRTQSLVALSVSVVLASVLSHALVRWLRIETRAVSEYRLGTANGGLPSLVTGSSLISYGLDWQKVARQWGCEITVCGVPNGSAAELEHLQSRWPQAAMTVVGLSIYEFNEHNVSDYRAALVPLTHTLQDLWQSRSEWAFCKRVLSQYPLHAVRKVFPSAGWSVAVMVGLREKLREVLDTWPKVAGTAEGASFDYKTIAAAEARVADWDQARLLRKLAELRDAIRGCHAFRGPKRLALQRLLKRAAAGRRLVVVVLPVSPPYHRAFLDDRAKAEFESAIAEAKKAAPTALWLRLDELPQLQSEANYWDLVHLNVAGRAVATQVFLERLSGPSPAQ